MKELTVISDKPVKKKDNKLLKNVKTSHFIEDGSCLTICIHLV